ncbi:unnamed protein product [Durusdinium trenchii]|uniref:Uncharacterized protein n=1 Tax=Durusdinium trenchii TaxID=1381693 RepID=A0ABP0M854_9DINO
MGTTSSGFEALQEPFDAIDFQKVVNTWLAPMHLQCSNPLQVGWYNKARSETADGTQTIDAPDDAVAFAIYSVPRYLEVVLEHYAREKPAKDLVDGATNSILDALRLRIPSALDAQVINTDKGPPYFHVQTIGAVCAEDQHVEAEDVTGDGSDEWREDLSDRLEEVRDPKMWGTESEMRRKIFAVNVHPVWGGWRWNSKSPWTFSAMRKRRRVCRSTTSGINSACGETYPRPILQTGDIVQMNSSFLQRHLQKSEGVSLI